MLQFLHGFAIVLRKKFRASGEEVSRLAITFADSALVPQAGTFYQSSPSNKILRACKGRKQLLGSSGFEIRFVLSRGSQGSCCKARMALVVRFFGRIDLRFGKYQL